MESQCFSSCYTPNLDLSGIPPFDLVPRKSPRFLYEDDSDLCLARFFVRVLL